MREFKCKKSLFKRTYGKNAFTRGRWYTLVDQIPTLDSGGVPLMMGMMLSNEGLEVSFVLNLRTPPYYYFNDYFDVTSVRLKDEKIIDAKLKLFIKEHS